MGPPPRVCVCWGGGVGLGRCPGRRTERLSARGHAGTAPPRGDGGGTRGGPLIWPKKARPDRAGRGGPNRDKLGNAERGGMHPPRAPPPLCYPPVSPAELSHPQLFRPHISGGGRGDHAAVGPPGGSRPAVPPPPPPPMALGRKRDGGERGGNTTSWPWGNNGAGGGGRLLITPPPRLLFPAPPGSAFLCCVTPRFLLFLAGRGGPAGGR